MYQENQTSDLELFLSQQDVACEQNQVCPNYIAKVVIVYGSKYRFCTGFLTDEDTIATSTSCLPNFLRRIDLGCENDLYLFFPKTANRPAERVGCSKILQFSSFPREDDVVLWRDDVSFIKLDKKMPYRKQAQISREGVSNGRTFTTWMVDQQGQYSAIIKRQTCEALHNTFVNPLASNESSPNLLFGNCTTTVGGTGAPIVDSRGKVRAVVSKELAPEKIQGYKDSGLLRTELVGMAHATNFACAPTIYDEETLNYDECRKDLTYSKLDHIRANMISNLTVYTEAKHALEQSISSKNKYIEFDVALIENGTTMNTKITPKCFKPLPAWLSTMNDIRNSFTFNLPIPTKSFSKTMSEKGRIEVFSQDIVEKKYNFQFSVKSLRSSRSSTVFMWNESENLNYPNLKDNCSSLF